MTKCEDATEKKFVIDSLRKREVQKMASPQKEYMALFINMSKVIAMWPLWRSGRIFSTWYYGTLVTVIFFIGIITISLLLKIATSFQDMDGIATVIDFATVYASGFFRYNYIFIRGAAYKRLIDNMYNGFTFESFNTVGKKMNMKASEVLGTRVAMVYYFGSFLFIFQMIIVPVFIKFTNPTIQIPLIFDGWCPFNSTLEPMHSILFTVQSISWLLMGYHYLLIDGFWYMIIILTIGQLQLIAHSYRNLVPQIENDENAPMPVDAHKVLFKCVKQHQFIRRFIQDIENIVSPIIIVDFMHALLSITFLLLDITIAISHSDWAKVLHLAEYFVVSVVHMFAYDYLGNELVLQEEKVSTAIYSIPWYRDTKSTSATLILTAAACRKPNRLTGGKFYFLTLEFFAMTMKTIFSYFMVIFQLRNGEEFI